MKTILYVSRALIPSTISHSLSIMKMCQAFSDQGHKVTLIGLEPSNASQEPAAYYGLPGGFDVQRVKASEGFDVLGLRRWLINGARLAWHAKQVAETLQPNVIYSRLTLVELLLLPKHIPIIYEMHSLGFLKKFSWEAIVFKWLVNSKRIRRLVATSQRLVDELQSQFPDADVVLTRLSAEEKTEISRAALEEFRAANLLGSGFAHHVGYTGNLDQQGLRGTEMICQAASQFPQAAFHIVGGSEEDVAYWKNTAEQWNGHKNIFFYGYRPSSQIPYFLNLFDVVLAPLQLQPAGAGNTRGMSPLKLAQYFAYGKPIVASDVPAHLEILQDGRNALVVPAAEASAWAGAVQKLLGDKTLRGQLGAAAARDYEAAFTPSARVTAALQGL